ncbi:hypothetical protein LN996_15630, partial [Arthrobacter sp. AK01]
MGIIGQIVARRASSPRASGLPRQRSLRAESGTARVAAFEGTTAVGTVALSSEDAGLLGGLGTETVSSETGSSDVGPGGGVHSADVAPGLRVIPTADSKRVAGLIEAGLPSPGMAGVSLAQADEAL